MTTTPTDSPSTDEADPQPLAHGCTCGECNPACPSRWLFQCCGACVAPAAFYVAPATAQVTAP